jgi:hypothetical protein
MSWDVPGRDGVNMLPRPGVWQRVPVKTAVEPSTEPSTSGLAHGWSVATNRLTSLPPRTVPSQSK